MITFVTESDLVERFSADEINALAASADVEAACQDASEEAASYVMVRYTLPLPSIPAPLVVCSADIARFRLYKDRATDEVKYRYERAVKWLENLSAGKVLLTFDPPLTEDEETTILKPVTAKSGIATTGVFGDAAMDRMPRTDRAYTWGTGSW